jgi:hypothetical protein
MSPRIGRNGPERVVRRARQDEQSRAAEASNEKMPEYDNQIDWRTQIEVLSTIGHANSIGSARWLPGMVTVGCTA